MMIAANTAFAAPASEVERKPLSTHPAGDSESSLTRPLRVLHVVYLWKANSAYYFKNIFDYTDHQQIESSVVTLAAPGEFDEALRERGTPAYALDCDRRSRYPSAVRQLSQLIKRERIDIVHTHTFDPSLLGFLASRLCGAPLVVTRHYSVAIHLLARRHKRAGYLYLERLINGYAAHILAPSLMVRDILIEREGVPPAKVSVVPYGQTTERFNAVTPEAVERVRASLGMGERLSLVYVARLDEGKGHRYLFEAMARLVQQGRDLALYLVGIGPAGEALKAKARELGVDGRVKFLGWRDDALTVMAAADLVVHPSLHEALSQTVIEAIVLERPIVATDVSGVRDTIGDSEFGLIVPPADSQALCLALDKTIDDLEGARQRARAGRRHVLQYMGAERVAMEHVACYRKVASRYKLERR